MLERVLPGEGREDPIAFSQFDYRRLRQSDQTIEPAY